MQWLEALVLGVVQGITEFLPVSSDGHLNVAQALFAHFSGATASAKAKIFFFVMLHVGTTAAILVHYRATIAAGLRGFRGSGDVAEEFRRSAIVHVGVLALVATLPLVPLKLFFLDRIEAAFDSPTATGYGFWITAAALLLTLFWKDGGHRGPRQTFWWHALLIGVAQAFAPLPGVSRSGLTIAAALVLGFRRSWAVGFSLLIAVPAIAGATILEIKDVDRATLTPDRIGQTLAATVVAGLVGYAAIVGLVRIVRAGNLWYFSVYLIVLGGIVVSGLVKMGRTEDAADANAPGRAARADALGPDDGPGPSGPRGALDRGDRVRPRQVGARPRAAGPGGGVGDGLDLGRPLG